MNETRKRLRKAITKMSRREATAWLTVSRRRASGYDRIYRDLDGVIPS